MASKKEFKKDINFLTNEIIMRGMIHLEFFNQQNSEQVFEIMGEAVNQRNDYIKRVNQRLKGQSGKEVKVHFQAIYKDLLQSTFQLLERIDKLEA